MNISRNTLTWLQRVLQGLGNAIIVRVREEPVITVGLFRAAITVGVGFGLSWTGEQVALMVTFIEAVTAFISRREVTSTASPNLPIGTVVNLGSDEPNGIVIKAPHPLA